MAREEEFLYLYVPPRYKTRSLLQLLLADGRLCVCGCGPQVTFAVYSFVRWQVGEPRLHRHLLSSYLINYEGGKRLGRKKQTKNNRKEGRKLDAVPLKSPKCSRRETSRE